MIDQTKFSTPETFGPGLWFSIHLLALNAEDANSKKYFIKYIQMLCDNIKCSKCKNHLIDYVEKNPPEDCWGITPKIDEKTKCTGMFYWSWKFHNAVNLRLDKPVITLADAYKIVKQPAPCTAGCNVEESTKKINTKILDVLEGKLK